ncbi:MAG: GDSL-type esterase/lipase family protein [Acidobacteria bacterium]|nr:GDSL-type esterase/lipase family protein [Acidobacteriota bacterium]
MDWYLPEVSELAQRIRKGPLPPQPVAFYGSSSIRLWSNLAADLADPSALNLGFGGSTLAACVHFFDHLIPLAQPHSLLVYAGDNDLGDGQSPEFLHDRFLALADKIANFNPTLPWAFLSIKLSPARLHLRDSIAKTNALIQSEVLHRPHAAYIDVASPMLQPSGLPRPELYAPDGLHLSPAGYQQWAETLKQDRNLMLTLPSSKIRTERLPSMSDAA